VDLDPGLSRPGSRLPHPCAGLAETGDTFSVGATLAVDDAYFHVLAAASVMLTAMAGTSCHRWVVRRHVPVIDPQSAKRFGSLPWPHRGDAGFRALIGVERGT
jgi:hypothetical protein